MAYCSYFNSDSPDTEDSCSQSNLSVSVGYFPSHDIFFYENTTSDEEIASQIPSLHFLPPVQGMWKVAGTLRLRRRHNQSEDIMRKFSKLRVAIAWDVDVTSNNSDSTAAWDLNGTNQCINRNPDKMTELTLSKLEDLVKKLEEFVEHQRDNEDGTSVFNDSSQDEDFQLSNDSSSPSEHTAQVGHQKQSPCQDTANFKPPKNEDVIKVPQIPLRHQEHELREINQPIGHLETSTIEASNASSQAEEEDSPSDTQTASFLNFGDTFQKLRQQVVPSLVREKRPEKITKSPWWVTLKRRLLQRYKRIQPQESPISEDSCDEIV
ncbi:PREDICTED: uncharacterized protein C12orf71 homolog [Elephantulus edwardii]|uniref:uncharacterized protein C12orf71 homolog n=1 Tax=Elephantulus edwardii TaxID=28737 RepID=UPI0003F0BD13|nr:PREDICTED: uncharacterized protein C12orf71 homolog [Elephantulus edwardii]